MYPRAIAEQLRSRGHDVVALTERSELRSLADDDVFAAAQSEARTVVTENIDDFSVIANRADDHGRTHYGLLFVDPSAYPRGQKRTIGRMVTALDRVLRDNPEDEPSTIRQWL